MKAFIAFTKKEWMDHLRSGKLWILMILFILFGIMNPAITKLTPYLLDIFSQSVAESGMSITIGEITSLDSWTQFFKNMPMALIVFLLIESNIFTKEHQSGTLILALTKGLNRYKVLLAKAMILMILWTVGYWICFGITFGYNMYYWDNEMASNLLFSVGCWWVFGLWCISLLVFFSSFVSSNTSVLIGILMIVVFCYVISLIPQISEYMPTYLMDGTSIIYQIHLVASYDKALIVSIFSIIMCFIGGIMLFNQKQL